MKHPSLKNLLLLAISALALINLSAQSDTTALRKNSVAVNVNGVLGQIFSNGYNSQSFLTYRRHFQKWNLRVGIGGFYSDANINGTDPT